MKFFNYFFYSNIQSCKSAIGHAIRLYGIHTTYVREQGYWHSNHASKYEPHFAARAS